MSDPTPGSSEQILWSGTVSNLHYFGKWILVFILVGVLAGSFLISFPNSPGLLWAIRAALLLLTLFLIFWIHLDRISRKYAVSNKRVSAVSYTHLRAHETRHDLVCRLLLEKKK